MSLVGVDRRFRELGRIRLGEKGVAKNGKPFPKKLDGFRLTSPSHHLLLVAADLYGGEVRRWDGAPGQGEQWELYIGDRVDVLLPPGEPLTQAFELWSGGGCQRRCNGLATIPDGEKCLCPADITERMAAAAKGEACKPTTRLSVILPRVPDIGIWRMDTTGYNAAVELPGTVDLLRALNEDGNMIPAFLRIDQRTSVRDGQTRHFVVPVLELPTVTVAELQAGRAIQPPPVPALTATGLGAPAVTIVEMLDLMNRVQPEAARKHLKEQFMGLFGDPSQLAAEQVDAAWEFLGAQALDRDTAETVDAQVASGTPVPVETTFDLEPPQPVTRPHGRPMP